MSQIFNSSTSGGGSAIQTITGNDAIPESAIANNFNIVTANATIKFNGTSGTETIDFGPSTGDTNNLVLGSSLPSAAGADLNVGVGLNILSSVTTAVANSVFGSNSMYNLTIGNNNCTLGQFCGISLISGSNNVFIGLSAATQITSGSTNIAIGSTPLGALVSGNRNIAIGPLAGDSYTTNESDNICINHIGTVGESNALRIGTQGTGSNRINACFIAGITGATVVGTAVLCAADGQLGTIVSSKRHKDNIKNIDGSISILNLHPVEFTYKADPGKNIQFGLIAEEVHEDFPYLCFYDKEGRPESVKYHELPVFLLKEVQRLNARIESLENQNRQCI